MTVTQQPQFDYQSQNLEAKKSLLENLLLTVHAHDIENNFIVFELEVDATEGETQDSTIEAFISVDAMIQYFLQQDIIQDFTEDGIVMTVENSPTYEDPARQVTCHTDIIEFLFNAMSEAPDLLNNAFLPVFFGDKLDAFKASQQEQRQYKIDALQKVINHHTECLEDAQSKCKFYKELA